MKTHFTGSCISYHMRCSPILRYLEWPHMGDTILLESDNKKTEVIIWNRIAKWHGTKRVRVHRMLHPLYHLNTLRPRQNGCHFADDTFKRFFLNENVRILIKISLKFVSKGPIKNTAALVKIIAGRRPGDKPLSKPLMVILPTHIWVTRPQWVELQCTFEITAISPRD